MEGKYRIVTNMVLYSRLTFDNIKYVEIIKPNWNIPQPVP